MKITVRLDDELADLLRHLAAQSGSTPSTLAKLLLEDALRQRVEDDSVVDARAATVRDVRDVSRQLLAHLKFLTASTLLLNPQERPRLEHIRRQIRQGPRAPAEVDR